MVIDRQLIFNKFNRRCAYCGCPLTIGTLNVDHVVSKKQGGTDEAGNLYPSCGRCNRFKCVYSIEEFRHELNMQTSRLTKNAQFMRALDYKQIKYTGNRIVFHFEQPKGVSE